MIKFKEWIKLKEDAVAVAAPVSSASTASVASSTSTSGTTTGDIAKVPMRLGEKPIRRCSSDWQNWYFSKKKKRKKK